MNKTVRRILLVILIAIFCFSTGKVVSGPDTVSRGFVYVRESEELMEEAQEIVDEATYDAIDRNGADWPKIKNAIRDGLSDFLWKRTKRNPMILPILMDAEM